MTGSGGPASRPRRWIAPLRRIARPGRRLAGVAGGVVIGLVIAGTVGAPRWPFGSEDRLDDGEYLVVLSGKDDSVDGQRQRLIDTWNNGHPHQKARIEVLSSSADKQHSEMLRRAQSGSAPVDVYNLDVTWTAEFAAGHWIRSLSDVDTAGFLSKPLDTCRYSGDLWALPFNTDAGLLFYRPSTLRAGFNDEEWKKSVDPARHPPSWYDIKTDAERVRAVMKIDAALLPAAYTGQFADYEGLTVNAMEAVWAAGGDVVDENDRIVLTSEKAINGIASLREGFADTEIIDESAREQTEAESTQSFREGRVLFMRNWPVAFRQLAQRSTDERSSPADDFAVTRLPGPSALGGQNLAVSSRSRHPEAARALIEFLTDDASQQALFQDGGLASTRVRTYQDPQLEKRYPYAKLLLAAVEGAKLRPVTAHYWSFSQVFRQVIEEVLNTDRPISADQIEALQLALKGKMAR